MKTPQKSTSTACLISNFFAEDSHVRLFQLLDAGVDLTMLEEPCSLKLPESLPLSDPVICFLKMFPDCYRMASPISLVRWVTNSRTASYCSALARLDAAEKSPLLVKPTGTMAELPEKSSAPSGFRL